ncbi:hypothetical protein [Brevundimonas lutea]|uniref:SEL1-like repeat protein n=1 Tax=Brevundimonas lutea TaxID=2293980 RepID=UPI001F0C4B1C|nr:hypothetical protein [Brevundimonas lutea]
MSAASPWSVKGIDPKAREIAKDLARRSGMTLGDWLNQVILEDGDDEVIPLPRRGAMDPGHERRGRSRRLDDAYPRLNDEREDAYHRLTAQLDALAARLEGAEHRSTLAIAGVDQAVTGIVRRLDGEEEAATEQKARLDEIADELRAGHRRLRQMEDRVGPETEAGFKKVETAIGSVTGRLYDIEERQRLALGEIRQRVDQVESQAAKARPEAGQDILEKVGAQVSARLDAAQSRTSDALRGLEQSFAQLDQRLKAAEGRIEPDGAREAARFEKLAESLTRQVEQNREEMFRRLDVAATENRLDRIERAVSGLTDQLAASERRSAQAVEAMGREIVRIAENLDQRLKQADAEVGTRIRDEMRDAGEGVTRKFARAVENLGERLDTDLKTLSDRVDGEIAAAGRRQDADARRLAEAVDQRLTRAGDQQVLALEKLGGEIARISERLGERIAQSERRSASAIEDITERLATSAEKNDQLYARASGDLADRMRQSEERTARLLAEAREAMERRAEPVSPPPAADPSPDWRVAAFPGETFESSDSTPAGGWSDDPLIDDLEAQAPKAAAPEPAPAAGPETPAALDAPFGFASLAPEAVAAMAAPTPAEPATPPVERVEEPSLNGDDLDAFGGADVSDVFAATAPPADHLDPDGHEDHGEHDFVDPRQARRERAASTQSTIAAARAAMTAPEPEQPATTGGLLRKGGKSKLQLRLDRQARKDGGTVKKAFLASVTAVALTGGVYGYMRLTESPLLPSSGGEPDLIAASLTVPTDAPAAPSEGERAYQAALTALDAGEPGAVTALTRAAELGYAPAQLHLARLYETGDQGVTVDPAEARIWSQRAAENGSERAMHNLALMLYAGQGGAVDQAEAASWFRQAAERGLTDSQFNLAKLYADGAEGVARDPAEALRWYLIAGQSGDLEARAEAERIAAALPAARRSEIEQAAQSFVAAG